MSAPIDSLAALRAFVAAADTRSFKAAGQSLGVSSSAVGKAIARLEAQLSVSLFHRTTRTIALTEAGGLFLVRAQRMLQELQAGEAELAAASGSPRGRLRVSAPMSGGLLTPALEAFVAKHPLVALDLDYSDRLVDVIDEGFDVVIRTGDTGDTRLLRKSLGRFSWMLAAAPGYLARHGRPRTAQDLLTHVCLRQKFSTGRVGPWPFRSDPDLQVPVSLTSSVIDPLLSLCHAGVGVGCFPEFLIRDALADGRLEAVLDGQIDQTGVMTVLWPASRYRAPSLRAFVDCLSKFVTLEPGGDPGRAGVTL